MCTLENDHRSTCLHKTDFNLKGAIVDLAKKTPTGQTALKMEVVLSKLDFKFSAHFSKHKTRIISDLESIKLASSQAGKHKMHIIAS